MFLQSLSRYTEHKMVCSVLTLLTVPPTSLGSYVKRRFYNNKQECVELKLLHAKENLSQDLKSSYCIGSDVPVRLIHRVGAGVDYENTSRRKLTLVLGLDLDIICLKFNYQ